MVCWPSLPLCDEQDSGSVQIERGEQPMMMHMSLPTLQLPALEEADIVLAGFRDCTQEALRYLREVEKLPEDDPLIAGLKHHLIEKQQFMDYDKVLTECSHVEDSVTESTNSRTEESLHLHSHLDSSSNLSTFSASPLTSDTEMIEDSERSEVRSSVAQATVISPGSQVGEAPSSCDEDIAHSSSDEDMSQSVLSLALLAQNNPAIASLTEEILCLLENEDADDEDMSDFDDDDSLEFV